MKIKFENYILEQCPAATDRFDIVKLIKGRRKGEGSIKVPTGEEYEKEEDFAFGCDLEYTIKLITSDLMAENESTVTLKEFLDEYKKIQERVLTALEA